MLAKRVIIKACGSVSPLGAGTPEVRSSYQNETSAIRSREIGGELVTLASVPESVEESLETLINQNKMYQKLDRSVLLGILASRLALREAGWDRYQDFGVCVGSARGAAGLFETFHAAYLKSNNHTPVLTSPTTTSGNLSSWVAQDLNSSGPCIDQSATCTSSFHALATAYAFLKGGLRDRFLAGGSEAPLTPFTLAQMRALRIYTNDTSPYPCRPFSTDESKNTFVLGEGSAMFALEVGTSPKPGDVELEAIGFGLEKLEHPTSITPQGLGFESAMRSALKNSDSPDGVDLVIAHAPGTAKGDAAELEALHRVFGPKVRITSNKWRLGHTFGSAGAFNLEFGLEILTRPEYIDLPYPNRLTIQADSVGFPFRPRRIMLNAAGFGGMAISLILRKLE